MMSEGCRHGAARVPRLLALVLLSGCAQLAPRPSLPNESALAPAQETPLDLAIAPLEARHPAQSGFRLLPEGTEAFVARVQATRMATRSIDVQMYIWHPDLTGRYLAQELLRAADRGVKVRVLLDDVDSRSHNDVNAALDAHPNVEIRIFNPFASRHGTLGLIREGLTSFGRINRRMHNKTWIADNRIAFVGGRNIGDEYFGASDEVNFVDLDFAMLGPVVRDVSASFDNYWNSAAAYPMAALDPERVNAAALEQHRSILEEHEPEAQRSRYALALRQDHVIERMLAGDWPLQWTANYEFVADDPRKVTMSERDSQRTHVGSTLTALVETSRTRLSIISPYFVPGDEVTSRLVNAARSGRQVRVLTNSLVANDVAAVHGGYSRYREALLEGGVKIWELKPLKGENVNSSMFGSSGASLHTKAFVVDGLQLFVGSYNLDPRSTWLNCEQGVLVEEATLAQQLEGIFAQQTSGAAAWEVMLDAGHLHWSDGKEQFDADPRASAWRRFQAWLTRVLHLEAQL